MYGQELPEVIPPSPTVANLMQFEEVPVSYYTGQPNISIPIYSKALTGELSMNIALSYNTQGVKINNRSGWTGTGWSLNAGGVVSRTVRDVPDEILKDTNGYNGDKTGVYHNTAYWDYENLNDPALEEEYNWKANGTSENKYDTELDLYQFDFMGYSGRFVVVKDGSFLKAKQLTKSNLRIEINDDGSPCNFGTGEIDEVVITDTNGYIYTFDLIETSAPTTVSGSVPQGESEGNLNPTSAVEYISINTAWHLTSIENSTGENLATLTYNPFVEQYTASVSRTYNRLTKLHGTTGFEYQDILDNQARLEPEHTVSYYHITATTQKVSEIVFRDGTSIVFNTATEAHPETGGAKLASIEIKNTGASIPNKKFGMTYETTTDTGYPYSKRLWLMKVTESGTSTILDYTLEYNSKDLLAGFDNVNATDDWGYNTGSGTSECGLLKPDGKAIKQGLLKKIIYPTGGSKEFIFERNKITYFGDSTLSDDEYRDKNPDNWNLQSLSYTFDSATENSAGGSTFFIPLISTQEQEVVYQRGATGATTSEQFNAYIEVTGPNGYLQRFRLDKTEVKFTIGVGTYQVKFGTLTLNTTYAVEMCIGYKQFTSTLNKYIYGGGVRIEEILFKNDPDDNYNNERRIIVEYEDEFDSTKSSGVLDSEYYRLSRNYTMSRYGSCPGNFGSPPSPSPVKSEYEVTEKGVRAQITQGGYVGYRHVKVYEVGNGHTTYTYTSAFDEPSPPDVFDLPHPKPSPNIDFKRGLLLKERIYNELGDILKETSNVTVVNNEELHNYIFTETALYPARYAYKNEDCAAAFWYDTYSSLQSEIPDNTNGCTYSAGLNDTYASCNGVAALQKSTVINQVLTQLTKTTTIEHFYDGGIPVEKEVRKEFQYNSENYQVSVEDAYYEKSGTTEHLQTKYYYPVPAGVTPGSNFSATLVSMRNLNMITAVLETETFRNTVKLNETHNIYHPFYTDFVVLKEIKVGKESQDMISKVKFHEYDTYGNPLEVSKTDGVRISYLWGHNKSLPIAQLINAEYSDIPSIYKNLSGNISNTEETNLRNVSALSNALINVFRYDPIIGLTSSTDEKGYEMSYEYDDLNRLELIRDGDNNILSKNSYHYKNQN